MGIILSSKKASLLTSPWFLSWTMYVLKNSLRRAKPYMPDPKRSFESIFMKLQGKIASPSHIMHKIKDKIPDVTSYPKAAFENIKDRVNSVPDTLSQIKENLPDVSSYPKAVFENLKERAEAVSEGIKGVISDASSSSITKLEDLKEKVTKAGSKLNFLPLLSTQIPTRSVVIKMIKLYFWKIILLVIALYSVKIIISYILSRFEALIKWALKKSGGCLLVLLKKIWNVVLKGVKLLWNKIIQKWQNDQRQETDSGAERNQDNNQFTSEQEEQMPRKGNEASDVQENSHEDFEGLRTSGIVQESGEKCFECLQQLKIAKVGNAPILVCMNSQCAFYSPLD